MIRSIRCGIVLVLLGAFARALPVSADTLEMKDRRVINGKYVGGTQSQVRFQVGGKVELFPVEEILTLALGSGAKESAGGHSQWYIMTYGPNTPEWNRRLGPSNLRMGCSDLPADCLPVFDEEIKSQKATKAFVAMNEDPDAQTSSTLPRLKAYASQYSRLSLSAPYLHSIGLDDFGAMLHHLHINPDINATEIPSLVRSIIDATKSVNPNLKFGVTIYEDDLDDPAASYIDDSHLPKNVKARIDYVHLYIHYRKNGLNYEHYVRRAKQMFPNAKIIAGSYNYDRVDYYPCLSSGTTKCSLEEEIDLYKRSLEIQVQLLKRGVVEAIEFCCNGFGSAADREFWSSDPSTCRTGRMQQCVDNTKRMYEIVAATLAAQKVISPTPSAPATPPSRQKKRSP